MIKIRFKNTDKYCPESWAEVTFLQFAGHTELDQASEKDIVAFFLGVSKEVVERMSVIEYGKVIAALQFTNKPVEYVKPKLYTKDIGLDEVGKFERLKEVVEGMSVIEYGKVIVKQVYGSLNIYLGMEEHEVNELDTATAINLYTFFLRNVNELLNGTKRDVILYRLTKMLKAPALAMWRKLGSFFTRSITYRGVTSLKSRK